MGDANATKSAVVTDIWSFNAKLIFPVYFGKINFEEILLTSYQFIWYESFQETLSQQNFWLSIKVCHSFNPFGTDGYSSTATLYLIV